MKLLCLGVGLQGEEGQLMYLPSLPHVLSLIKVLSVVAVGHPYMCNLVGVGGGVIGLLRASEIVTRSDLSARAASASTKVGKMKAYPNTIFAFRRKEAADVLGGEKPAMEDQVL